MQCPDCKGEMKPLFSGMYCPRECDLPPEKRTKAEAKEKPVWVREYQGVFSYGFPTDGLGLNIILKEPYGKIDYSKLKKVPSHGKLS